MALNPPISATGVPLRVDQEYFVLYRNDMECEVKIQGMGKFTAKGKIYLTTCRIVFVNDRFNSESFKSFDFPLAYLHREKFQQPIFGSNYLEGDVDPLYNLLPGSTHFKIWFKSGGCDRFLRLLVDILRQIRRHRQNGQMVPEPRMLENFARTQSQAYMDPNDPSIIYVQQPQLNQQSYGNTAWGIPQNKVSPMEPPNYLQQPQQPYQQPQTYQQPQNYQQSPQSNFQYPPMGVPIPEQQFNNPYNQNNNQPPNQNSSCNQQYNPYNQPQQQQFQQPQQSYQPPQQSYQPPPQQQYQPPQQQYQPPPQQYQPPPQEFQPPQQQYQPPPQQYQPPPQQYQPPPQQYQPAPEQPQQIQQPPQQNQQQQDQIRNQPTMAYYYGFWGPQLQSTQNGVL